MVKVTFLTGVSRFDESGSLSSYAAGRTYELDKNLADEFIASGVAELFTEEPAVKIKRKPGRPAKKAVKTEEE